MRRMLSWIFLPFTKADWFSFISIGGMGFNVKDRIFEIILHVTLQYEIGLKSLIDGGLSVLGISVMAVQFIW